MLFKKPQDIRYTDMAIWVDEHMYNPDCDDMLLYKYIYLLVEMLARKRRIFKRVSYYEDFTLFAANYLYKRVCDSRDASDEQRTVSGRKIVSILNYIKVSLFGLQKNFEREAFAQHLPYITEDMPVDRSHIVGMYRSTQDFRACEYTMCIEDLPRCVLETCKKTPYTKQPELLKNIYTSVLLTILNQITISKYDALRLQDDISSGELSLRDACRIFQRGEPLDGVILFRVPCKMKNYILFLANRSKKALARDLSQVIQSWEPSDLVITSLLQDQVEVYLSDDEN